MRYAHKKINPTFALGKSGGKATDACRVARLSDRKDARAVEEARLESVYTPKGYPGFESPSFR